MSFIITFLLCIKKFRKELRSKNIIKIILEYAFTDINLYLNDASVIKYVVLNNLYLDYDDILNKVIKENNHTALTFLFPDYADLDDTKVLQIINKKNIGSIKYICKFPKYSNCLKSSYLNTALVINNNDIIEPLCKLNPKAITKESAMIALKLNNLYMLTILNKYSIHEIINKNLIINILDSCNIEILKYAIENGGEKYIDENIMIHSILTENLDIIKYIGDKYKNFDFNLITTAEYTNNLNIVNYIEFKVYEIIKKIDF